jgi:type III pantothenate kinase
MILCDIGNTHFSFYKNGRIWKEPIKKPTITESSEQILFISVNQKGTQKLKYHRPDAIDISSFLRLDSIYRGLGVDRVAVCMAIKEGVIIDAGSAITVDVVQNSIHLGGYILPGLNAFRQCYADISPILDINLNPNIDISSLPQSTEEAVSYGVIKSTILTLQSSIKTKNIYFTGGDGKFFAKFFDDAIYDESLVFKGMIKALENIK